MQGPQGPLTLRYNQRLRDGRQRSKATKAEGDMVAGLGAILSNLGFVSGPNEEAEMMGAAA